jgi:hypothetical protein
MLPSNFTVDAMFFTDGKPWRMSRVEVEQLGKCVQPLVLKMSTYCSKCNHDASVLCTLAMIFLLSNAYLDGDCNCPEKNSDGKSIWYNASFSTTSY